MSSSTVDHTHLNIRDRDGRYLCPACGWPGYFSGTSYTADGADVGSGICPCCLFEPGFDDDPEASSDAEPTVLGSIMKYRAAWIGAGMPWRGDPRLVKAPEGWDANVQLRHLIEVFLTALN